MAAGQGTAIPPAGWGESRPIQVPSPLLRHGFLATQYPCHRCVVPILAVLRLRAALVQVLGDGSEGSAFRTEFAHGRDGALFADVVGHDDMKVTWEELGQLLMTYAGWGLRLQICDCGEE